MALQCIWCSCHKSRNLEEEDAKGNAKGLINAKIVGIVPCVQPHSLRMASVLYSRFAYTSKHQKYQGQAVIFQEGSTMLCINEAHASNLDEHLQPSTPGKRQRIQDKQVNFKQPAQTHSWLCSIMGTFTLHLATDIDQLALTRTPNKGP